VSAHQFWQLATSIRVVTPSGQHPYAVAEQSGAATWTQFDPLASVMAVTPSGQHPSGMSAHVLPTMSFPNWRLSFKYLTKATTYHTKTIKQYKTKKRSAFWEEYKK
jgi:hypothetical protein